MSEKQPTLTELAGDGSPYDYGFVLLFFDVYVPVGKLWRDANYVMFTCELNIFSVHEIILKLLKRNNLA